MEDICGEDGEITDELKSQCIMIGDRHFDIDGAVLNNIASIGVLYGYGSREELEEAGATFIAENTKEVGDIVLGI
jgi:phosphoglycolate phosphatase